MKGMRRRGLWTFTVFLMLWVSAAWGAVPQEALSKRSPKAIYMALSIDDLGGLVRYVLSSENIDLFAPLMDEKTLEGARMISAVVSKMPVGTAALAAGTDENLVPFLQLALALPAELQPKLDLVESGQAKAEDIVSLLLGDGGLVFAPLLESELRKGDQGFYSLKDGSVVLTARSGLLLMGLSAGDLEASLKALADREERLPLNRRLEAKNLSLLHLDFATMLHIAESRKDEASEKPFDEIDANVLGAYFKAPLEIEYGYEKTPEHFLVSVAANVEEAFSSAYLERLAEIEPEAGGALFLTGTGRPLFALGSKWSFKSSDLAVYPEVANLWKEGIGLLAQYGISEAEVENLLSGSVSLVCGGSASVMGGKSPGAYLALTGREGAAASIFKKIVGNEDFSSALPTVPVEMKDWEAVLQVDPALLPLPVLLGVKGETLFLGIQDAASLNAAPELSAELRSLLEKSSMSTSFFDFKAIGAALNNILNDEKSPLPGLLPSETLPLLKGVLGAELSVPFVGIWAPQSDRAFAEGLLVEVPAGKGLMAEIVKVAASLLGH